MKVFYAYSRIRDEFHFDNNVSSRLPGFANVRDFLIVDSRENKMFNDYFNEVMCDPQLTKNQEDFCLDIFCNELIKHGVVEKLKTINAEWDTNETIEAAKLLVEFAQRREPDLRERQKEKRDFALICLFSEFSRIHTSVSQALFRMRNEALGVGADFNVDTMWDWLEKNGGHGKLLKICTKNETPEVRQVVSDLISQLKDSEQKSITSMPQDALAPQDEGMHSHLATKEVPSTMITIAKGIGALIAVGFAILAAHLWK